MPAVKYKLNYRNITLQDAPGDEVPVLRRNGERQFFRWLGFIDVNVAKQLPGARPVRLDVTAYSVETFPMTRWEYLEEGETVQGCLVLNGVYGITHSVLPRVVKGR